MNKNKKNNINEYNNNVLSKKNNKQNNLENDSNNTNLFIQTLTKNKNNYKKNKIKIKNFQDKFVDDNDIEKIKNKTKNSSKPPNITKVFYYYLVLENTT